MNKYMFLVGIAIIAIASLMMFCQERCFLGVDLESWPAVLGIIGIGFISASNTFFYYKLMKQKKKK
jgi:hypothetical protein